MLAVMQNVGRYAMLAAVLQRMFIRATQFVAVSAVALEATHLASDAV